MALSSGIRNSRFPSSRRSRSRIAFAYWLVADKFPHLLELARWCIHFRRRQELADRLRSEFKDLSMEIPLNSSQLSALPSRRSITPNLANAAAVEAVLRLINSSAYPRRSTVRDHDLPEMPAALEMAVGRLGLGEGGCPIDNRTPGGAERWLRSSPPNS